jgi:hypothetical protein
MDEPNQRKMRERNGRNQQRESAPNMNTQNTAMRTPYRNYRWRPYRVECTGSLPTSEVKRRRARLVLGWGTAREDLRVLPAFRIAKLNDQQRKQATHCTGDGC